MMISLGSGLPDRFFWLNRPEVGSEQGVMAVTTAGGTDFWQRTHYGFSRDNGHAMLTSVSEDFALSVRTRFEYRSQYDQCGLLVRVDALNWLKVSAEREDDNRNRLGSVVTNLGYSDWATTDIDSGIGDIWYRVVSRENDFILKSSRDGENWTQLRIAHLHSRQRPLNIGIYACSPADGGFTAHFSDLTIEPARRA